VGVNPLMSMLSAIAERNDCAVKAGGTQIVTDVLYATKVPQGGLPSVLFAERIAGLFGDGRLQGRLSMHVTGGEEARVEAAEEVKTLSGADVRVQAGRLTRDELRAAVVEDGTKADLVYVCGPPAMTDEFVETLASGDDAVIERGRVMTEKWW
jgi:ferredoxin-NADP reductase